MRVDARAKNSKHTHSQIYAKTSETRMKFRLYILHYIEFQISIECWYSPCTRVNLKRSPGRCSCCTSSRHRIFGNMSLVVSLAFLLALPGPSSLHLHNHWPFFFRFFATCWHSVVAKTSAHRKCNCIRPLLLLLYVAVVLGFCFIGCMSFRVTFNSPLILPNSQRARARVRVCACVCAADIFFVCPDCAWSPKCDESFIASFNK